MNEPVHIRLLRDFMDSLPADLGSTRRIELRDSVKRMLDEGWFQAPAPAHELTDDQIDTLLGDHDAALNNEQRKAVHAAIRAALAAFRAPAVGAEPVRYPHPDEDDPVTLWKEIRRLRAAMSQAKCDCTAYCGQYVLHGSCRAHPAPVTISHVPVQPMGDGNA